MKFIFGFLAVLLISTGAQAQALPAACQGIKSGQGLNLASWKVLKAAQMICAASPELNWSGISVHFQKEANGRAKGWAKIKKREAHVSAAAGPIFSQVEVLQHELMGHLLPKVAEHNDLFRRSRMASAVKLGWLTQAEMDKALSQGLKERVYQAWMYPRIRAWMQRHGI